MYEEHEEVKNRKWFDTEKFLDIHEVKFTGFRCPRPIFKFEHANFPDYILNVIRSQEDVGAYKEPTAMQCLCWPILLSGRDMIAVTNSGYGKHLSFILPLIVNTKKFYEQFKARSQKPVEEGQEEAGGSVEIDKPLPMPTVLILTPYQPTKDDIYAIAKPYLDAAGLTCVCIYESEDKADQIERLKQQKFDFLIANPSRLLELINEHQEMNTINFLNVRFLVVDEYIQFRKSQTMDLVKNVVNLLRTDRQTAVFSRLVPSGIQRQGDEFVKNCVFFEMHYDKESAQDEIKQIVELCDKHLKSSRLIELVDRLTCDRDCKILIYAKDKEKCLNLNFELKRNLDLDVLDFRREDEFVQTPASVMSTFKNIGLEIAIPDLDYIVNVDFPPNLQTYMDRLRKGVTHYTFFAREDAKHAERLIYSLKQARQEYDANLAVVSKAWLECGRDVRFMPMMQDIQKGISKPLPEMILSSGDEEAIASNRFEPSSYGGSSGGGGGDHRGGGGGGGFYSSRYSASRRRDSQTDQAGGEDDESEEDVSDDEDADFAN